MMSNIYFETCMRKGPFEVTANSKDPDGETQSDQELCYTYTSLSSTVPNDSISRQIHTCYKLWTKICETRDNVNGDLTKFCEIFLNITLELPKYSLKYFFQVRNL